MNECHRITNILTLDGKKKKKKEFAQLRCSLVISPFTQHQQIVRECLHRHHFQTQN